MKLAQIAQVLFIVAAAVGVFSFVRAAQNDQRLTNCQAMCSLAPTYAAQNRRVPDFELPDMDGKKVRFSSFLGGKPVVLNFWTKTCPPCLEEMDELNEMAAILRKDGVRLVTVTTDDGPEAIKEAVAVSLKGAERQFEILFDPDMEVVTDVFGTTLFPETWVIDGSGIIRLRVDRSLKWNSALAMEVIEMIGRPLGCPVEFSVGRITRHGELCDCSPSGGTCMSDVECCDPSHACVKGKCLAPPPKSKAKRPPGAQQNPRAAGPPPAKNAPAKPKAAASAASSAPAK
jgi:peroxiredoxin